MSHHNWCLDIFFFKPSYTPRYAGSLHTFLTAISGEALLGRCSSAGRVLTRHLLGFEFNPQHFINQIWQIPIIPVEIRNSTCVRRLTSLTVSLRAPAWHTREVGVGCRTPMEMCTFVCPRDWACCLLHARHAALSLSYSQPYPFVSLEFISDADLRRAMLPHQPVRG